MYSQWIRRKEILVISTNEFKGDKYTYNDKMSYNVKHTYFSKTNQHDEYPFQLCNELYKMISIHLLNEFKGTISI